MEIKNKNIFLNLNEGEEIVYVAEKDKYNFYWNLIFCVIIGFPLISFFTFLAILEYVSSINAGKLFSPSLFMFLIFPLYCFITYKIISDYFCTELILTNQRFIISKFNKIKFINYEQVKCVTGTYGVRGGPIQAIIRLKNKKFCNFFFIDRNIIRNKFKEVYPSYDDSKAVAKEQKQGYIILVILLLLLPFFWYAEYKLKLSDNQNNPHKTAKRQHYSKTPYFDKYMANLQDEIKRNWSPPKGKESSNVILLFKVDRNGNVLKSRILKSSNNTAIDNSALGALKKSEPLEPLEPLPNEFKGNDIDVQFNFDYNVLDNKPKF